MNTKIFFEARDGQNPFCPRSISPLLRLFLLLLTFSIIFTVSTETFAQAAKKKPEKSDVKIQPKSNLPKVTQIDAAGLKNLLKPNGKPLLINFWATWCEPCREEFPDLVKIGADYKDKLDLVTISLDELSEIDNDVPKFLAQMKSETPAYLLKVPDEGEAITVVSKEWQGALPFTILFDASGITVYEKQGKFNAAFLRSEIEKIVNAQPTAGKTK